MPGSMVADLKQLNKLVTFPGERLTAGSQGTAGFFSFLVPWQKLVLNSQASRG